MLDLTITVLHYNRWDLTKECLASIDAQEIPCTYEKVLVDNGSTHPSLLLTRSRFGTSGFTPLEWRVVRYEDNRGHIVGQNRCFESAKGAWVLFVANDVRLHPHFLQRLWAEKDEGMLLQPKLLQVNGEVDNCGLRWSWPGYGMSFKQGSWPDAITSTCYLVHKRAWQSIGKFDETLHSSHEDIDFGLRARRLGYALFCGTEATATHLGNATLKRSSTHTRAAFHRDRVYVIKKHYRGLDRLARLAAVNLLDTFPRF